MKACWKCAEQIQDAAIACRFCGANQNSLDRQKFAHPLPKSGADSMKPILKFAFVAVLALLIAQCVSDSGSSKPEQLTTAKPVDTPEQEAARLKTCQAAEKIGRKNGMIKEIRPPEDSQFGGRFYEIVVDERGWNAAEYQVKMTLALLPLCLALNGSLGGDDDYVMVKSHLTKQTLASGSPSLGTVGIESD